MLNTSSLNVTTSATASHGTITAVTILGGIPMILIGITSFLGNALVLLVIYRFKNLQTFSNAYIGSLAITDVLASLVMPLSYATLLDGSWVFGETLCQIQGISLIMLSTASMLTLLCLSIYRCYLVTTVSKRLSNFKLGRMVKFSVGMIWLLAILYSITPLFRKGQVKYLPTYYSCLVDFRTSRYYFDILFLLLFTIPLIVMTIAYARIIKFINIHNQTIKGAKSVGERPRSQYDFASPPSQTEPSERDNDDRCTVMELKRKIEGLNNENCDEDSVKDTEVLKQDKGKHVEKNMEEDDKVIEMKWISSGLTSKVRSYSLHKISPEDEVVKPERNRLQKSIERHSPRSVIQRLKARSERQRLLKQYRKQVSSQTRLARVLLATVVLFAICWAPLNIDAFILGIGYTQKRPKYFQLISLWLAYTNALCNPIIYAFLNTHFRVAFAKILKGMFDRICHICHH